MASYRSRRVKMSVPMATNRFFVQNLNKGDKVSFPPGCTPMGEPVLLSDDLFQKFEEMPILFTALPFAFYEEHEKQEDIQKILQYSFKLQKTEDVTHCAGFVCTVVCACLKAIDVSCTMQMGYRKIEKDRIPHVWLEIGDDGVTVDNMYEKYMTKKQIKFLEESTPNCYLYDSFEYPSKIPDDKDEFAQICYKKNVEIFLNEPDKGMTLGLNQEQLYIYYFDMIRFMWESFGVHIAAIDPLVRHYCWGCGGLPPHSKELLSDILPDDYDEYFMPTGLPTQRFKHCSLCMISSYCCEGCQENDWDAHHRFVCVSRIHVPGGSSSD